LKSFAKIAKIVLLSVCLHSCASKVKNNTATLEFPRISYFATCELEQVCDDKKCPFLKNWMYDIMTFQQEYELINRVN
jgi:hypothetical protein